MKNFFTSSLLCFLSSTSLLYAMQTDDAENLVSKSLPGQEVIDATTDDWKAPFYQRKFDFSEPRLDERELNAAIFSKKLTSEQIRELLREEAAKGNSNAQEKLYGFYTKPFMGFNLVDEQAARDLLNEGVKQEKVWAYWAQAKKSKNGEVTKWHCLAANRQHPEAKRYLKEYLKDYSPSIANQFVKRLLQEKNSKKRTRYIDDFKTKWEALNYGEPFFDVALSISRSPPSTFVCLVIDFLEQAGRWGHIKAIKRLDQMPFLDENLRSKWIVQGAKLGESIFFPLAADCLWEGFEGQAPDKSRALGLYLQAAELNHARATYNAGLLLSDGFEGQPPDKPKALKLYLQSAKLNSAEAMCDAGLLLSVGFEGQAPDKRKALELYLQAAELNSVGGMCNAGTLLAVGFEGQPPDKRKALEFYLQSAKLNSAGAMYNAGILFAEGFEGQAPDKSRALGLYLQAAKLNDSYSMFRAGILLSEGFEGQAPDKRRALRLYLKAAELNHARAMYNAGTFLMQSYSGDESVLKQAKDLFSRSAARGISLSMVQLGRLYLGEFSPKWADLEKALFWLERAKSLNDPWAAKYLEKATQYARQKESVFQENAQEKEAQLDKFLEEIDTVSISSLDVDPPLENNKHDLQALEEDISEDEEGDSKEEKSEDLTDTESGDELTLNLLSSPAESDEKVQHKEVKNPKYIREQMRKVGELQRLREENEEKPSPPINLSVESQEIVDQILSKKVEKITHTHLEDLFKDPFFNKQVIVETTSVGGIMVTAHNRKTNQYYSTSTHTKHKKDQKGCKGKYDPVFFNKHLKQVFAMFDLG